MKTSPTVTLITLALLGCQDGRGLITPGTEQDRRVDMGGGGGTGLAPGPYVAPAVEIDAAVASAEVGGDAEPLAVADAAAGDTGADVGTDAAFITACFPEGQSCQVASECCPGFFCNNLGYAPWRCTARQATGQGCTEKRECESNLCSGGHCVSCAPLRTRCAKDDDCCSGSFCDNDSYTPFVCTAALPAGAYCKRDAQCQSQRCVTFRCVSEGTGRKRIFHHRNGALGQIRDAADTRSGVEVADAECMKGATAGRLGGTWKAWLSSSTENARDRIVDVGPWYRIDGVTKLFENKAQLAAGPFAPIDPPGARNAPSPFWSGTLLDGTRSAYTCHDWTNYLTATATVGRADAVGAAWAQAEPVGCGYYGGLLCIEQ